MKQLIAVLIALCLSACAGNQSRDQILQKYTSNGAEVEHDGHCFYVWPDKAGGTLFIRECSKGAAPLAEGFVTGLTFGLITPDLGPTAMVFVAASKKYLGANCKISSYLKVDDGMGGTTGYEIMYQC